MCVAWDFKTALWSLKAIATFTNGCSNHVSCPHPPRTALRMEGAVVARGQHTRRVRRRRPVVGVLLPRSTIPEDLTAGDQRQFAVAVRGDLSRASRARIYVQLSRANGIRRRWERTIRGRRVHGR